MKTTYSWLKSYVDFDLAPEELVEALTMLGLEVNTYARRKWSFNGIVVGKVIRKSKHQNADRLSLCEVDIGDQMLSIVCGAPNVAVGQIVPVATSGTRMPNGMTIKKSKIRGVESQGMICSEWELGLSDRKGGIMVLDSHLRFGGKLTDVLGEEDVMIDLDLTPNRPDCFGVIGIAREIAAYTGRPMTKPELALSETGDKISHLFNINILDVEKCPRYTARYIRDVSVQPSPWWLAQRLESVGFRSINNIVDVTNFVMMETGQPLHAFDADLLAKQQINVRAAKNGEVFTTLDGKEHTLNSECLMICDGEKPVALGGIMGGRNSEVSEETGDILLESAFFDAANIRRTAKSLGISTESSKRFERGVDPNGVLYALDRAAQLISELGGGNVVENALDIYPREIEPAKIKLRPERVCQVLGVDIPAAKIKAMLSKLECEVTDGPQLDVEVPTFRPDLTREIDLVEEVARMYGYDEIPSDTSAVIHQLQPENEVELFEQSVREKLVALGFSDVVTYNLSNPNDAELFAAPESLVKLINPLSEELSTMRPSLLPALLNCLRWNLNRGNGSLRYFELGTTFHREGDRCVENSELVGLSTGLVRESSWQDKAPEVNLYHQKGVVLALFRMINLRDWRFEPTKSLCNCANALAIYKGEIELGYVGELKQDLLSKFGIAQSVLVLSLGIEALGKQVESRRVFRAIPKFPAIKRDLALLIEDRVSAQDVILEMRMHGGTLLQDIHLFDVYSGTQVDSGFKSLAFNLTFYSTERTLTEDEVDGRIEDILNHLAAALSARLRD